jgi:hypothetical protein
MTTFKTETIMKLTQEQYDQLLSNYAESIVDGMDMDDLVSFAIEQLELNLRANCSTDNELFEEIERVYDSEVLEDMLESIGVEKTND